MRIKDRINCLIGKHKWEIRNVHLTVNGSSFASSMLWCCSVCKKVDFDRKLDKETLIDS